ncbi:uncharacterized protein F4822DRAFT_441228 [Hypoxylon trugodes]|uniref:uncharacterized protein n=1 Tax=Hypoxylon trugodes TaxID=326681 RepID=UPI0021994C13|nr:uncharacterized protein F4822DRAFT_441228 [Hypoxylon trugodes]KAI1392155.1 hypothetical protein F4822DRAFT_441228 [Hypoxylon trugodes]
MGNVLGRSQVFYIPAHDSDDDDDDDEDTSDDESYAPYGWPQALRDIFCGIPLSREDRRGSSRWDGAIVGLIRRPDCTTRDHWALKFRSDVDVSSLPRRIRGFRTRIPSRCERICSPKKWRRRQRRERQHQEFQEQQRAQQQRQEQEYFEAQQEQETEWGSEMEPIPEPEPIVLQPVYQPLFGRGWAQRQEDEEENQSEEAQRRELEEGEDGPVEESQKEPEEQREENGGEQDYQLDASRSINSGASRATHSAN